MGPNGRLLTNFRCVTEVDGDATVTMDNVDVPELIAALVLRVSDPATVRRPARIGLPLVGADHLNRPGARRRDLPQVCGTGDVRCYRDLRAVRRKGGIVNQTREKQILECRAMNA